MSKSISLDKIIDVMVGLAKDRVTAQFILDVTSGGFRRLRKIDHKDLLKEARTRRKNI